MRERVGRVILAYKRRMYKKLKKRSPLDRLKARIYYRKNKTKIKLKRRRYAKRTKLFNKTKKLFQRSKPVWYSKKKLKKPRTRKPPKGKIKKTQVNPRVKIPTKPLGSKGVRPPKSAPKPRKFKFYAPKRSA